MPARTLAIGDIHGCLGEFEALLHAVGLTSDDHLILLGDLIDRGPDSAGVIKRVRQLSSAYKVTILMGNHEQMMLAARDSHAKFSDWLRNGGDATLRSYAGARATLRDVSEVDWQFLSQNLRDYFETDTHIFVHANAYPDMAMDEQPDYMLRWERCDSIAAHDSGKVLVCGHTPQKSGRPMNRRFAICIDTYAVGGGVLTCLETGRGRIWQAARDGRVTRSHLSDFGGD
jgi:serine/threonine protein phosphatase 1